MESSRMMTVMPPPLAALLACLSSAAWAQLPDSESPTEENKAQKPAPAPVTVAPCGQRLPALRNPLAFAPGELLEFDLDAMGATAGKMTMQGQKKADSSLPAPMLRPSGYTEDAMENDVHRTVDVAFNAKDRSVRVNYTQKGKPGSS